MGIRVIKLNRFNILKARQNSNKISLKGESLNLEVGRQEITSVTEHRNGRLRNPRGGLKCNKWRGTFERNYKGIAKYCTHIEC
jgi:hypothetical protein